MKGFGEHCSSGLFLWVIMFLLLCSCGSSKIQYTVSRDSTQFISDTAALLHKSGPVLVYEVRQDHYLNRRLRNYVYFKLENKSADTIFIEKGWTIKLQQNADYLNKPKFEKSIDSAIGGKIVLPKQQVSFFYEDWSEVFEGNLNKLKEKLRNEKMTVTVIYKTSADFQNIHLDSLLMVPNLKR